MKASVDSAKCTGHARCNAVAPQVFTVNDDGYCSIGTDKAVPPELEAAARAGAANCPERAITLSS
ncbi:ferredoxin [Streptomyces sp. CA-288835]|uniref:ferredoxin n=1 Tax=Streptomyces sp. CA-288835 TaxID=3240069 RepID=UPI003D8BF98C